MRLFALTAVFLAGLFGSPEPAECFYCPTYSCYGPCLTPGCVCLSQPGGSSGRCYGVQQAERLVENGAAVLR